MKWKCVFSMSCAMQPNGGSEQEMILNIRSFQSYASTRWVCCYSFIRPVIYLSQGKDVAMLRCLIQSWPTGWRRSPSQPEYTNQPHGHVLHRAAIRASPHTSLHSTRSMSLLPEVRTWWLSLHTFLAWSSWSWGRWNPGVKNHLWLRRAEVNSVNLQWT